jgi:hypothetical protein
MAAEAAAGFVLDLPPLCLRRSIARLLDKAGSVDSVALLLDRVGVRKRNSLKGIVGKVGR